jgi:hypothetical protein
MAPSEMLHNVECLPFNHAEMATVLRWRKKRLNFAASTAEEANILRGGALARSDDEEDDEAVKFANTLELALHWRMNHDKAGCLQENWTRSLRGVLDKSKDVQSHRAGRERGRHL